MTNIFFFLNKKYKYFLFIFFIIFNFSNVSAQLNIDINYPVLNSIATTSTWNDDFEYTTNNANSCAYQYASKIDTSLSNPSDYFKVYGLYGNNTGDKIITVGSIGSGILNNPTSTTDRFIYSKNTGDYFTNLEGKFNLNTWSRPKIVADDDLQNIIVAENTSSAISQRILVSDDGGKNWYRNNNSPLGIVDIKSSLNEDYIYAVSGSYQVGPTPYIGYVYKSTDFGVTWATTTAPVGGWNTVDISNDGSIIVVGAINNGKIMKSVDYGLNWVDISSGQSDIVDIAISDNGQTIYSISLNGHIYKSTNGGSNWSVSTSSIFSTLPTSNKNIVTSQSGQHVIVSNYNEAVYISSDYGSTWQEQTSLGNKTWDNLYINDAGDLAYVSTSLGANDGPIFEMKNFSGQWNSLNYFFKDQNVYQNINCGDTVPLPQNNLEDYQLLSMKASDGINQDYDDVYFKFFIPKLKADDVIGQDDFSSSSPDKGLSTVDEKSLNYPYGVFLDTQDNRLFVSDSNNNRILVYGLTQDNRIDSSSAVNVLGQPDFMSTTTGLSINKLNTPAGLTYDYENKILFVQDSNNRRILGFDLSSGITNGMDASYVLGQEDFVTNTRDTTRDKIWYGMSLYYHQDKKQLFVVDSGNTRILIFDLSSGITNGMDASYVLGQPDFTTLPNYLGLNSFDWPNGISYDLENDYLFVADMYGARVLIFDLSSGITNGMDASYVLGQEDFVSNDYEFDQDSFGYPGSVVYDIYNKKLFISTDIHRVTIFDLSSGITNGMNAESIFGQGDINSLNEYDVSEYSMSYIETMDYDSVNKLLYLLDSNNNRVLLWDFVKLNTVNINNIEKDKSFELSILSSVENSQGDVTFSIASGNLPPGLILSSDGVISGTPITAGTYSFVVKVTDTISEYNVFNDSKTFTFTVIEKIATKNKKSNKSGGLSLDSRIKKLIENNNIEELKKILDRYPGKKDKYEKYIDNQNIKNISDKNIEQKNNNYIFAKDMEFGYVGNDVLELQKFLNKEGFFVSTVPGNPGSIGNETNYFGNATKSALINFQNKFSEYILKPIGLTNATGYFGQKTRDFINK